MSFKSERCSETTAPYKRCLELTAPTELIITKDEAPPENNCNKIICEAPPKIIIDMPIVSKGENPISIERTPNIKPKGTTGIINGLTSIIPFKKILKLLFISRGLLLEADYMINMNWSFNSKLFINLMLMNMV